MTIARDLNTAVWRKSSYSNGDGGACVEVADGLQDVVPVRDSKAPDGPVILVAHGEWSAFVETLKDRSVG
ncbi:DUF397 domain-containing protein [Streptomyces sp. DT24]|uniref:DUF397 domain-containing protein n=1 Tax=unclassified Streptomyces TaxID=2593676 RepID=UPI0023B8D793|nr:DUF397 domain-containing protein [Streptomyces sp. AM 4-1-1]WEH33882.1 DUF397 domain-containing protein [Streptomyces sp. AM 4-1-1]